MGTSHEQLQILTPALYKQNNPHHHPYPSMKLRFFDPSVQILLGILYIYAHNSKDLKIVYFVYRRLPFVWILEFTIFSEIGQKMIISGYLESIGGAQLNFLP